jgi:radical SAM protein with 4Fe4S-binding SPASM domain
MDIDVSINSIGVGITNKCNLNCPHCYSRVMPQQTMTLESMKLILEKFPNLKSINFGTGESILNPEFPVVLEYLYSIGIEISLTTNGLTLHELDHTHLAMLHEIDVSLDFPIANLHNQWRGMNNSFQLALSEIERCKGLNIPISIAACLMKPNYQYLRGFKRIIDDLDCYLRLNIYKPVKTNEYSLSYEEFWNSVNVMADDFYLIANSEPILSILTKKSSFNGSPCGASVRIHPDLSISSCVYLDSKTTTLDQFRLHKSILPVSCIKCEYKEKCNGGCLGRRYLTNGPNNPDIYCPFVRKLPKPDIYFTESQYRNLIHSSYLCTIILR